MGNDAGLGRTVSLRVTSSRASFSPCTDPHAAVSSTAPDVSRAERRHELCPCRLTPAPHIVYGDGLGQHKRYLIFSQSHTFVYQQRDNLVRISSVASYELQHAVLPYLQL